MSCVHCGAFGRLGWRPTSEILLHRQIGEDPPLLRHVTKARTHDLVRRRARDIPAFEHDAAGALLDETHDRAEGRRLAGAVAAEQRHDLAVADLERDVEQDMRGPIMAVEVFDTELHADSPFAMAGVIDEALAKIDRAHFRVAADLRRRSLRDQAAAVEHQDAVGMLEHDVHVVLGEEHADRLLARDLRRQSHQFDALARRHARGRLVHQQKPWLVGKRDRQFQPLEIAIGELAAGPVGIAAHADQFEQAAGFARAPALASTTRD